MTSKIASEQSPELKTAEGGAWRTSEMLERGFTLEDLARRRRRFEVSYWKDRFGGYHYPKWQFDQTMNVLPDIVDILRIFRTHDTLRVLSWFVRPVTKDSKSLLDLIRKDKGKRAVEIVREEERQNAGVAPLSKKQVAELKRRLYDMKDETRYVVASCWTRKSVAFYDIQRGLYTLNEIEPTCLVRRRDHAEAIARCLDRGRKLGPMLHQVAEAKATAGGIRLTEPLAEPRNLKRRFWPRLRPSNPPKMPVLVPLTPPNTHAHVLEAFLYVYENREAVCALVADAPTRPVAVERLVRETLMSESQASAALELRLWHFTTGEYRKFLAELRKLGSVNERTQ